MLTRGRARPFPRLTSIKSDLGVLDPSSPHSPQHAGPEGTECEQHKRKTRPSPRWDLWYQSGTLIGYALPRETVIRYSDPWRRIIDVKFADKFSTSGGGWISSAAPLRELVLLGTKLEQRPPDLRCEYGP
uniref:Uncharacterized protein n=1 Tax=Vespula pensylvanica TaxID=30213 RepID=A0A834NWJ2_VESPE|nr:hypothetical protein H0235_010178 [Vespula pensylvanica]